MDAQLDPQQLPRSTAQRVDPTLPALPSAVAVQPHTGAAPIDRGVRPALLVLAPRAAHHALRWPAGALSRPTASGAHTVRADESGQSTGSDASAAPSAPVRHRHPGRKTHVPDL